MNRIDPYATEAEFVEFRFADETTAIEAERCFPIDFVRTGHGIVEYRTARADLFEGIRDKLEAAGIVWTESESALTEAEMWPEGEDEADYEAALPTP